MGVQHLAKIGLMGLVGHYDAPDHNHYARGTEVICRTRRGLEVGVILCSLENEFASETKLDGQVLRTVGREDRLILERLERHRDQAFDACQRLIRERQLPGTLVDVEHLFDGESVYFYFMGCVDERLASLTADLASTYERKVRFKKFAETLAAGCGPDCGTGASKCSSGGCGSCAIAGSCGVKSAAK